MKIFELTEDITQSQLSQVEAFADKLFAKAGIDVEFTRHFMDRMNDDRNGKPISAGELVRLFKNTWIKFGRAIEKFPDNFEAVIHELASDVNVPFVINDRRDGRTLVNKTIMRKKDFKTSNRKLEI